MKRKKNKKSGKAEDGVDCGVSDEMLGLKMVLLELSQKVVTVTLMGLERD